MTIVKIVLLTFAIAYFVGWLLTKDATERVMCMTGYIIAILGIVFAHFWGI